MAELEAVAKDANDARCALIRQWMHDYWLRGPSSVGERNQHLMRFAREGADACLTAIVDSPEAAKVRSARRKEMGL